MIDLHRYLNTDRLHNSVKEITSTGDTLQFVYMSKISNIIFNCELENEHLKVIIDNSELFKMLGVIDDYDIFVAMGKVSEIKEIVKDKLEEHGKVSINNTNLVITFNIEDIEQIIRSNPREEIIYSRLHKIESVIFSYYMDNLPGIPFS